MITSPPLPPSPPEGPPRGTNFSRRKAIQPFPPSPAFTRIFASSINMFATLLAAKTKASSRRRGSSRFAKPAAAASAMPVQQMDARLLRQFHRLDHHKLAHRALVQKLDPPRNLGKKRIVFAAAHVEPRLHARPALTHNDRSARHDLPAECLESQPLRVRIAPISRSSLSFFMCHRSSLNSQLQSLRFFNHLYFFFFAADFFAAFLGAAFFFACP